MTLAGETAARLDGRGRPRREGPARPAARDPRDRRPPGGAGGALRRRRARAGARSTRAADGRRSGGARRSRSASTARRRSWSPSATTCAAAEEERARLARKAAVLDTERSQAEQERGAAAVRLAEIEQALATAEARARARAASGWPRWPRRSREARAATEAAQVALVGGAQPRWPRCASGWPRPRPSAGACDAGPRRSCRSASPRPRARAAGDGRGAREELRGGAGGGGAAAGGGARRARPRARARWRVAEDRVRDLRNELEGREPALKERRREREMLRDALAELEVARARTESDLDHLGARVPPGGGHDGGGGGRRAHRRGPARATLRGARRRRSQEMRERLDRMGPGQRPRRRAGPGARGAPQFLTAQRQDLLDSIAELDQAHQEDRPHLARALPGGLPGHQPALRRDLPPALRRRHRRPDACSTRRTSWRAAST